MQEKQDDVVAIVDTVWAFMHAISCISIKNFCDFITLATDFLTSKFVSFDLGLCSICNLCVTFWFSRPFHSRVKGRWTNEPSTAGVKQEDHRIMQVINDEM